MRVLNISPYNLHAFFFSSRPVRLRPMNYFFLFSVIIETQSVYGSIKLIHDNISEPFLVHDPEICTCFLLGFFSLSEAIALQQVQV